MKNNLKILITGAEGFVGRNLVKEVITKYSDKNITLLVKRGNKLEIEKLKKNINLKSVKLIHADLVTGRGLGRIKEYFDVVLHLAASTDTSKKDHRANDIGTENLVNWLNLIRGKTHFIYTSTTAVYAGRKSTSKPIDFKTEPLPSNEYGRSKLRAEKYLIKKCKEGYLRLSIIRLSTVYGKGTRKGGLFHMLKELIIKKSLISRLNWPGRTGLIQVGDVVKILMELIEIIPQFKTPFIAIACTESLNMSQISEIMHHELNVNYRKINLPNYFWSYSHLIGMLLPLLERIMPPSIYNLFWRFNLVNQNTLDCKKGIKLNKPKTFSVTGKEVL